MSKLKIGDRVRTSGGDYFPEDGTIQNEVLGRWIVRLDRDSVGD